MLGDIRPFPYPAITGGAQVSNLALSAYQQRGRVPLPHAGGGSIAGAARASARGRLDFALVNVNDKVIDPFEIGMRGQ